MTTKKINMKDGPIHRLLLKFAAPAVTAMLGTGLYTTFSAMIISRGINTEAMGAAGIVFSIQLLYHGFAQLVSIGAASALSRTLGKNDEEDASRIALAAYVLTLVLSAVLILLTGLFTQPLLSFFGATDELMADARQLLTILKWTLPFNGIVLLSSALFRAEGDLKASMTVILLDCGLNLALDYVFIIHFDWGLAGAGYSTILSQSLTSFFAFSRILRKKSVIRFRKEDLIPRLHTFYRIFSVGISALARNGATTALALVVNQTLRGLEGTDALIAFGTAHRLTYFFTLPVMGFNQAVQPLASYNYGAGQPQRVRKVLSLGIFYTTAAGLIATTAGLLFPRHLIQLFTRDKDILEMAAAILRFQLLFFWTFGIQTLAATYYQAIGRAIPALALSIFKQLFLIIPLIWLLPNLFKDSLTGIWAAYPISEALAFLVTGLFLIRALQTLKTAPAGT